MVINIFLCITFQRALHDQSVIMIANNLAAMPVISSRSKENTPKIVSTYKFLAKFNTDEIIEGAEQFYSRDYSNTNFKSRNNSQQKYYKVDMLTSFIFEMPINSRWDKNEKGILTISDFSLISASIFPDPIVGLKDALNKYPRRKFTNSQQWH